ncbi:MAG: hypothetical protein FD132_2857, partial [bacterium]
MRRLALFALTALGLAALLWLLATDAAPELPRAAALSPADLAQGRALLASLGPRRPPSPPCSGKRGCRDAGR